MDSESERVVQEALDKVVVGRTTLVVAHRLSTIKNVDVIAVVDNGSVKEIGSHDELIQEQDNLYRHFVHLQQMEKAKTLEESESPSSLTSIIDLNHTRVDVSKPNTANYITPRSDAPTKGNMLKNSESPRPSFRRLLGLNKPEWKQAILGCLSGILFGGIEPLCAVIMGATVAVYFSTDLVKIKE